MYPQMPQAPAQPQAPQFPAQPQYPAQPQQFPQQPQYGQPQQQYAQPGAYPQQAAPAQQLAAGSLDSFFSQPTTGGGKALTFTTVGETYVGVVSRPITNGDIQQQTDTMGRPQFFRDGRPKFVMKVPLQMQPTATYPDGVAVWYVKGAARDELVRAMAEAGAPDGPPEAGAVIQVTHTGTRQAGPGMNPAKLFQVAYQRPSSAGQPAAAPASAAPAAQPVSAAPAAPVQQVAVPQPAVAMPQQAAPTAPAAPVAQPAAELSPEQQALLSQLTGAQPAAQ